MTDALPIKPRTKVVRLTQKLATVYFPASWTGEKTSKKWLRARGFSATENDCGMTRRGQLDGTFIWAPYAHCRTVQRTEIRERFAGESAVGKSSTVTPDDLLAMFDLLLARFKAAGLAATNRPLPEFRLKTTRRGRAHTNRFDPWFSVPTWVLSTCEEYVLYYMAHELAHHAYGGISHGQQMTEVERALLIPFDLAIEYRGGRGKDNPWYPARLLRPSTGGTVCGSRGQRVGAEFRPTVKPLAARP